MSLSELNVFLLNIKQNVTNMSMMKQRNSRITRQEKDKAEKTETFELVQWRSVTCESVKQKTKTDKTMG